MGRLIDADALKERFRNNDNSTKDEMLWNHTVRKMIEKQPTAYDVEAVVKELEELKQIEMNDECPMDICGDCECSKYKCKGCYTVKAIEIVRNGGVK